MFPLHSPAQLLLIGLGAIVLFLLIKAVAYGTKLFPLPVKSPSPSLQTAAIARTTSTSWTKEDLLPPLIDKPADHPSEKAGVFETPDEEQISFDLFEEESGTTLLKEAEQVVEQIQDVVDETGASQGTEVLVKIAGIVSQYRLFVDTEYFDAINGFIAVTIERDCNLSITPEELAALWLPMAA